MRYALLAVMTLLLVLCGCGESPEDVEKEKAFVKGTVSKISGAEPKVYAELAKMFSKKNGNRLMSYNMYAYPSREVHIDVRTERRPALKESAERIVDVIAPLITDKKEWSVSLVFAYPHGRGTVRDTKREGVTYRVKKGKRI